MRAAAREFLLNDTRTGLLLATACFLVYLSTLSPSIGYLDSAELATAASTLGIAHPTGYPLFTLLGACFARLPTGLRVCVNLNLMAAFFAAAAVFFLYRAFLCLPFGKAGEKIGAGAGRLGAATAALVLAFSKTYWSEAAVVEVYSLYLALLAAALWLFLKSLSDLRLRPGPGAEGRWLLFAFLLGLGFSGHMMMGWTLPAFLYLYFAERGLGRAAWTGFLKATPPFLAGLLPYLYLPLRAASDPVLNWGDPDSLERFWRHVSAAQYRFRLFSSLDGVSDKLGNFFAAYPSEFGYAPLALAAAGIWVLRRESPRLLVFSSLLFAGCLAVAVNYGYNDPDFYLNAYIATGIWIACGAACLAGRARSRLSTRAIQVACLLTVLAPLGIHYREADQSSNYAVEDYTRNVLDPLAPEALVFTNEVLALIPGAYYLQRVEGVRPDVIVVGQSILAFPWYQSQLENRFPGIFRGLGAERAVYARERARVEGGADRNAETYGASFEAMIRGFLRAQVAARPVYAGPEVDVRFLREFQVVPEGMLLRLYPRSAVVGVPAAREYSYRPLPAGPAYVSEMRDRYAGGYYNQGIHRILLGDAASAVALFQKSLQAQPGFAPALHALWRWESAPRQN